MPEAKTRIATSASLRAKVLSFLVIVLLFFTFFGRFVFDFCYSDPTVFQELKDFFFDVDDFGGDDEGGGDDDQDDKAYLGLGKTDDVADIRKAKDNFTDDTTAGHKLAVGIFVGVAFGLVFGETVFFLDVVDTVSDGFFGASLGPESDDITFLVVGLGQIDNDAAYMNGRLHRAGLDTKEADFERGVESREDDGSGHEDHYY